MIRIAVSCTALALFLPFASSAQDYPARPVKFISTFTAGSPADALMRMLAAKMTESVNQPVVVEVQAGAGGILGGQSVMRASPDGYTLLYTTATTVMISPRLVKNQPYSLKDFTPILVVSMAVTSMFVHPSFGPTNMKEFIAYARANPGKVTYGTNGIGGTYHLEMSLLSAKYGLDLVHVPYKGGTDALQAVVAGTLPVGFAPVSSALAQVRSGKVRMMGVLEPRRVPDLPDVPALGEQMPDYEKVASGVDIYGPAKLAPAVAKRIHAELHKAASLPDVNQKMNEIAFPYSGVALADMTALRLKDVDIVSRAIKAAGLEPK